MHHLKIQPFGIKNSKHTKTVNKLRNKKKLAKTVSVSSKMPK